MFVADAARKFSEQDRHAIDVARRTDTPCVLALNKVDLVKDKSLLLPLIEQYKAVYEFADYVPVSSVKRGGTAELLKVILKYLPAGPQYFPEDHVTDQPERFLAGELIREKVLRATRQEVPHAVAVTVDKWEDNPKMTTHLRHHSPGARRTEGDCDRHRRRHAEADRHAGPPGNGAPVRAEDLSGPACSRAAELAREPQLSQCPRLAYNDRRR